MSGPYTPLAEILPSPPSAGSLLQSAGTLAGDWKSGVSMPQHAWTNDEWPDCTADWETSWSGRLGTRFVGEKPLSSSAAYPSCEVWSFDPFTVYTPLSEVEVQPELARRLTTNAQQAHDAMLSRSIARVLWNPETENAVEYLPPFPQDTALNPTFGYATNLGASIGMLDPLAAYAALIAYYAALTGTTGGAMIHCAPVVLPYLINGSLVNQSGNRFLGPGGTIVVADAGYPNGVVPRDVIDDSFGSPELLTPESWMFITGPVEIATAEARVIDGGQVSDTRWNQWALVIEQRAIYRFDPAVAFGVPVCSPVVPCVNYASSV